MTVLTAQQVAALQHLMDCAGPSLAKTFKVEIERTNEPHGLVRVSNEFNLSDIFRPDGELVVWER